MPADRWAIANFAAHLLLTGVENPIKALIRALLLLNLFSAIAVLNLEDRFWRAPALSPLCSFRKFYFRLALSGKVGSSNYESTGSAAVGRASGRGGKW